MPSTVIAFPDSLHAIEMGPCVVAPREGLSSGRRHRVRFLMRDAETKQGMFRFVRLQDAAAMLEVSYPRLSQYMARKSGKWTERKEKTAMQVEKRLKKLGVELLCIDKTH